MAYLGNRPAIGNFVKLDDISADFDGNESSFATTVSGSAYIVSNPFACIAVADGNVLTPAVDFYFSGSQIVFDTAPTSSWLNKFFVIVYGNVLDSGIPSDQTITNAKLADSTLQYGKLSAVLKARLLANSIIFGA